jgi:NADH-quinone oxidoreductase subunit G
LESNFALRELVGAESFYSGVAAAEAKLAAAAVQVLREGPAPAADLTDLENADAVLVLGEDVTNTIPRWALALRQASLNVPRRKADALKIPAWNEAAVRELIQDEKEPFFIASPAGTRLDDVATSTLRLDAAGAARVGFAIAHTLNPHGPAVPDMDAELAAWAGRVAEALRRAERPVIVSGTGAGSRAVLHAAANIAAALRNAGSLATIALALPAANSAGLALLAARHLGDLEAALEENRADVLLVLETDLHARLGAARANALLDRCGEVVVVDSVETMTSRRAGAVLPAASFAEGDGTFVSAEGRAQELYQVMSPQAQIQESWRWVRDIARAAGHEGLAGWEALDDVREAVAKAPVLEDVMEAAPSAVFRMTGRRIPRQPHRYSGRTAMLANITVHEPKPPDDPDSPLAFSMEGSLRRAPNAAAPFFWAPAWNSQQSAFKFQQEIGGELRGGDPGVRLFGSHGSTKAVLNGVPPATDPRTGLLLTPLYHIFGSEELSRRAPGIAELSPSPYFALHPDDALGVGVSNGDFLAAAGVKLPVKIEPSLARGLLGYAAGYPETAGLTVGAKTEAAKA